MQVGIYYNNRDVRVEEMPKPKIGPGEILVKVKASGICGSDVMEWYRLKKAPLVLGHEIAGEIAEVGAGVKKYKIGDRVFVAHHVPCNSCHYCQFGHQTSCETLHTTNFDPGGFSEYIRIPAANVEQGTLLLPKEVSFTEATMIEPLACVVRSQRTAQLQSGQSMLILGAGISGLLHLLLGRASGAKPMILTDINQARLNLAKELGADAVLNAKDYTPEALRRLNSGRLADLVVVCTGAPSAFDQALRSVDRGGVLLFFAPLEPGVTLPLPVNDFWRNNIKIVHAYGSSPTDNAEALELLHSQKVKVDKLITHRLALKDIQEGFRLVSEAKECIKVVIEPDK